MREKLAELACYREGINAHLTAAIELAQDSPGGLLMPNQELLYTGRVLACTQLPAMMHLTRPVRRPAVRHPERVDVPGSGGRAVHLKYLAIGDVSAEDRRRLFAFARDLLNSATPATV